MAKKPAMVFNYNVAEEVEKVIEREH